ncbi:MAG TPA: hypothetical protein PKV16_08220 [Caldisericia bacterium]|nr:hypothetical protein [Caldisericia bacterium]HPF49761.1 hypothetical protein [Caldisericia bacterium]HPI84322.1 hypothetical protein [Caldisericia bacterium]HPQ93749.1 hypothetical protein [Caldisericia bacterium]HRV74827.1 hypothetical protein [Caldisericia bacterium]
MKKILSVLIVLVVVTGLASVLVSCGGERNYSEQSLQAAKLFTYEKMTAEGGIGLRDERIQSDESLAEDITKFASEFDAEVGIEGVHLLEENAEKWFYFLKEKLEESRFVGTKYHDGDFKYGILDEEFSRTFDRFYNKLEDTDGDKIFDVIDYDDDGDHWTDKMDDDDDGDGIYDEYEEDGNIAGITTNVTHTSKTTDKYDPTDKYYIKSGKLASIIWSGYSGVEVQHGEYIGDIPEEIHNYAVQFDGLNGLRLGGHTLAENMDAWFDFLTENLERSYYVDINEVKRKYEITDPKLFRKELEKIYEYPLH